MRIGLMGGTFDPIHYGHLFIAEEGRVRCGLDKVLFIPNRQPAHREGKSTHADAKIRFELTQLAVADNPCFEVSRVELDREGPSFAIDTIKYLQEENPDAELFFIMGGDSINEILTWHRGAEIFHLCRIIAASRPGTDLKKAREQLTPEQQSRVEWMEVPGLHIASRDLRGRVRQGDSIRYLLPDVVEQEIRARGLYRNETTN